MSTLISKYFYFNLKMLELLYIFYRLFLFYFVAVQRFCIKGIVHPKIKISP